MIYEDSFIPDERRDFSDLLSLLKDKSEFSVYSILRDKEIIGFLTDWKFENFIYIEHFAVSSNARGGGIGNFILQNYLDQVSLPVVLEVEKPEDEISKKRIVFYERLGFKYWDLPYIQPAYGKGKKPIPMDLMTYGKIDLNTELKSVKEQLYQHVYAGLDISGY
jgi:GNAT superfamily N-acetyltransferase